MTQGSNSTETIDRLPGMQEEDLRRKIPVDHLEYDRSPAFFKVVFHLNSMRTYRKEFAELRKVLKAYKQNHPKEDTSYFMDTTGNCWTLHKDLLTQFADLIELAEPLETIVARVIQEGKAEQERKKQEAKEQKWQRHYELRAYRIPCPNSCKVRVLKLEGIMREDPFEVLLGWNKEEPTPHHFKIELDEGRTPQEKEARLCLSKTLLEDKKDYIDHFYSHSSGIQGCGCNWELHEYALVAYSDWLELEEDIEVLIEREEEKLKRRAEEEYARWEKEFP